MGEEGKTDRQTEREREREKESTIRIRPVLLAVMINLALIFRAIILHIYTPSRPSATRTFKLMMGLKQRNRMKASNSFHTSEVKGQIDHELYIKREENVAECVKLKMSNYNQLRNILINTQKNKLKKERRFFTGAGCGLTFRDLAAL